MTAQFAYFARPVSDQANIVKTGLADFFILNALERPIQGNLSIELSILTSLNCISLSITLPLALLAQLLFTHFPAVFTEQDLVCK